MHDIYPFVLQRQAGEELWGRFWVENPDRRVAWSHVRVAVRSPIHIEFAVYDYRGLIAEISHSYSDTTLYPFVNEEQLRVAGRVLAERERLAAARELEAKLAAIHLELFGEPPQCESTDSND
jgi:hypothetical protein